MSINARIIKALSGFSHPVKPDAYSGKEKKYFTFNFADDRGTEWGDNEPEKNLMDVQVHFFMPMKENGAQQNYLKIKRDIREALFRAGFTYPEVMVFTETENNIRHLVFECQATEEREES